MTRIKFITRTLKHLRRSDLTLEDWLILCDLAMHPGSTRPQVSERTGVPLGKGQMAPLVTDGLVACNKVNLRRFEFRLTPAGEKSVSAILTT